MLKINSVLLDSENTTWIYLDVAAFQNFKVFLLLPRAWVDFARVHRDRKVKKMYEFEFRPSCNQRLMFHQGTVSLRL